LQTIPNKIESNPKIIFEKLLKKWYFPFISLLIILILAYPEIFFNNKSLQSGLIYPYGINPIDSTLASNAPVKFDSDKKRLRDLLLETLKGNSKSEAIDYPAFHVEMSTGAYYEAPINQWIGDQFRNGIFPLWIPNQSLGGPLIEQYSSRLFFPVQILENIFGSRFFDLFILLRQFIAGLGVFFLVRNLLNNQSISIPLIAGYSYALSGSFTWFFFLEQFTNAAMMLPFMLLGIELLTRKITAFRLLLATAFTALNLLSGQPEVALYNFLFSALFLIVLGVIRKTLYPSLMYGAISLGLGLMIAGPQILPFVDHLSQATNILHQPGGGAGNASPTPTTLLRLIPFPTLSTYPLEPRLYPLNAHWDYLGGYVGVEIVFLFGLGIILFFTLKRSFGKYIFLFFSVFCTGIILKNIDLFPFSILGSLPLFDQAWSPRWGGPTWVLSSILSVSIFLNLIKSIDITSLYFRINLLLLMLVVLYFCWDARVVIPGKEFVHGTNFWGLQNYPLFFWPSVYFPLLLNGLLIVTTCSILIFRNYFKSYLMGLGLLILISLVVSIPRNLDPQWMLFVEISAIIPIIGSLIIARNYYWGALTICIPTIFIFLGSSASTTSLPDRSEPYSQPAYVQFIKNNSSVYDRVLSGDGLLYGNYASSIGLNEMQGIWSLPLKDYFDFYWKFWRKGHADEQNMGYWFSGLSSLRQPFTKLETLPTNANELSMLSKLGVKYLITSNQGGLSKNYFPDTLQKKLRIVYQDSNVNVYENIDVSPRAFLAKSITEVEQNSIFEKLLDSSKAFNDVYVDSQGWNALNNLNKNQGKESKGEEVKITKYLPNSVSVEVNTTVPRLLVLTDAYANGWDTNVNGIPTNVIRVNNFFRGIIVPAGKSIVSMDYFPRGLKIGLYAFLIGIAGLILVCLRIKNRLKFA
jgi:hypothetical protein